MRAVIYSGPKTVRVEQVPEPQLIAPTDALVRVTLAAVCGTSVSFFCFPPLWVALPGRI